MYAEDKHAHMCSPGGSLVDQLQIVLRRVFVQFFECFISAKLICKFYCVRWIGFFTKVIVVWEYVYCKEYGCLITWHAKYDAIVCMTLVIVIYVLLFHIYLCVFCFIIGSCYAVLLKQIQVITRHNFGSRFFHLYTVWSLEFRHTFSAFVHHLIIYI